MSIPGNPASQEQLDRIVKPTHPVYAREPRTPELATANHYSAEGIEAIVCKHADNRWSLVVLQDGSRSHTWGTRANVQRAMSKLRLRPD
jgi:hypothetical protein